MMVFRRIFASLDWTLLGASVLLVALGLSMLASVAGEEGIVSSLFIRQSVALIVGLILMFLVSAMPYHVWKKYAVIVYGFGMFLLIVVAVGGPIIRGTISRIPVFGFQVQPSEFVKIALVLMLAWALFSAKTIRLPDIIRSALVVLLPVAFVLAEPDVGVAALMIFVWAGVLLFWGISWKSAGALFLIGLVLFGIAWQTLLLDYQKDRLRTFFYPENDPLSSGYNIRQSIIALGSGQLTGRGLGHGPQSQLQFLPERLTDFIFASIGEELGFTGVLLLVSLYMIVLWRIMRIARTIGEPFGQLLCMGVFWILFVSFTVSAGMNVGLLPVTGIPLPFVSYGGSSLVTTFVLLGIVQSVRVYSTFTTVLPPELSRVM